MKLSELSKKDIINIKDGKRIGKIVDVEFDINNGYMIRFIIESSNVIKSIFSSAEELTIKFSQIKKLGEDVILIDIST
ncbi:MAG: YlmC/YmxH family sporulation protein [Bacilli bacterium]|nr:YlmC/YmxH family sporulation protein [Bacilli bacterium]